MPILIMCMALLAACSPRKASVRACRKAERHIARAIWLCPEKLRLDSAHAVIELPARSTEVPLMYSQADVDSILQACRDLAHAWTDTAADTMRDTLRIQRAVTALRSTTCRYEDLEYEDSLHLVSVFFDRARNKPVFVITDKKRRLEVNVPCPPNVDPRPADIPPEPISLWPAWIIAFLLLVLAIIVTLRWHAHDRTDRSA